MNILESIAIAFQSISANKLRVSLTLLSVAIGVFAIMGAGALVTSIDSAVTSELANLGENTFIIQRMPSIQMGANTWRKYRNRKPISYSQAMEFKRNMQSTSFISAYSFSSSHTIKSGNQSTDPDVVLVGADEMYFFNNNVPVEQGRPFSAEDILFNRNVAVIGNDVVVKLFPNVNPLGKNIAIQNQIYTVIGILETKGAILGQSQDNYAIIPVTQFLKYYASWWEESLTISVRAPNKLVLPEVIDEAIGVMRLIRGTKPWEENSFELETNESLSAQFSNLTSYLTMFGFISGAIALISAGVGIMNIMLVSIKERTREIGIRKAVGAKRFWILMQFIVETITITQIGGIFGMILGLFGAWLLSTAISIKLVFPIEWVITSVVICTILGLVSGLYPAWKAAKLDPIEALRYE